MEGKIKSSKPSLKIVQSIVPTKSVLSVGEDGILTERGGPVYMTQSLVSNITTDDDRGACCEGTTLITEVSSNKEEIFLPVVCNDSHGEIRPIVKSVIDIEDYEGIPLSKTRIPPSS